MNKKQYPVIDLFSGPGGLGEGFSAYGELKNSTDLSPFNVVVSVEKERSARETLRMRAYYRQLKLRKVALNNWYEWLNHGDAPLVPKSDDEMEAMEYAERHAKLHELGGNEQKDRNLEKEILGILGSRELHGNAILIGGPPCQAYSLVGRARNQGNCNYDAARDHRHFLYREYLRIVARAQPAVFVMENVRGILSSRVDGERIFPKILDDLVAPHGVMGLQKGFKYEIHSLVTDTVFRDGDDPGTVDGRDFLIKSEEYGVPQKRHRVILLGIRDDLVRKGCFPGKLRKSGVTVSVQQVLSDLPELRSRLSKGGDSSEDWNTVIEQVSAELVHGLEKAGLHDVATIASHSADGLKRDGLDVGALRCNKNGAVSLDRRRPLLKWLTDPRLEVVLNHEARGHMNKDLERYLFVSSHGKAMGYSPGSSIFPDFLAPDHKNWKSGKFADRFRVQLKDEPSTTITSHISKDGHYFIHPDPVQCRSLTVREAARLQTFPDNYIFMGNRTEQYVQVGNAVPPYLALQIAAVVHDLLSQY